MAPKQTDPQFKLRLTPELKEEVERAAGENNRSMNAEILARLQSSAEPSSIDLKRLGSIVEDQQKIISTLEEMLENQFSLVEGFRSLLDDADRSVVSQSNMLLTLSDMLISMSDKVPDPVVNFARNVRDSSERTKEVFEARVADRKSQSKQPNAD